MAKRNEPSISDPLPQRRGCTCPTCQPDRHRDPPVEWPSGYYAAIQDGVGDGRHMTVCVAHQGRHISYLGECFAFGKTVPRPRPIKCHVSGCDEAPYIRHDHPQQVQVVAFDEEKLANAIVAASRATREERRAETQAHQPQQPSAGIPRADLTDPVIPEREDPPIIAPIPGSESEDGGTPVRRFEP